MKVNYIVSGIRRSVFFENTVSLLRDRGIDITVIYIGHPEDEFPVYLKNNDFNFFVVTTKSFLFYPLYIYKIYAILRRLSPDIVNTHLITANILGLPAAKFSGIKNRVIFRHSGKTPKGNWKISLYDKFSSIFSNYAIANTITTKQVMIEEGFPETKIAVINYGFNIARFSQPDNSINALLIEKYNPDKKRPVIGAIARPVEWKGIQYIIPAYKHILNKYPNSLLLLFNFSETDSFSDTINDSLSKLPALSYKKVLFERNVYDLYSLFDIFIHVPVDPYCEAFGQVYIEALAAGRSSIFTMSGVANDFVEDNKNALVVSYRNSEQIAEAIVTFIENPKIATTLAEQGRKEVSERFSLDKYIANLIDTYNRILNVS